MKSGLKYLTISTFLFTAWQIRDISPGNHHLQISAQGGGIYSTGFYNATYFNASTTSPTLEFTVNPLVQPEPIDNELELEILSPKEQTNVDGQVSLMITSNRLSTVSYRLDRSPLPPINLETGTIVDPYKSKNDIAFFTTAIATGNGPHTLVVYASDVWGNTQSRTVTFTKNIEKVPQLPLLLSAAMVVATLISISIIVWLRKRQSKNYTQSLQNEFLEKCFEGSLVTVTFLFVRSLRLKNVELQEART